LTRLGFGNNECCIEGMFIDFSQLLTNKQSSPRHNFAGYLKKALGEAERADFWFVRKLIIQPKKDQF